MVKVQEELGELAEQILKMDKLQRDEKGEFNLEELKKEFADVILSLLIFAKTLGLSLSEILDSKLDQVVNRYMEK